ILEYSAIKDALNKIDDIINNERPFGEYEEIYDFSKVRFAPIYDSGSSLGRELTEKRVNELLGSNELINNYISRGLSEIHWIDKKVSHFELVENLINSSYKNTAVDIIKRVVSKFNHSAIEGLIQNADIWIPEFIKQHRIPESRKRLILKLISSRFAKLKELIHA
ncbi:MAG: hypothetical protein JWQ96_904, partial [Segetibacter sp.]|nr:hypothetical protein [Segetibacter sp.]